MRKFFITGTDTDVGKSTVAAILMLALNAQYWKPIQSGESDVARVKTLTGLPDSRFVTPVYSFQASLSPDQAAALENKTIDLAQCQLPTTPQSLIVEGAGGVFVPLNQKQFMIDLIKQLALPVIVVARGKLGTINHTLLTLAALRQYNIPIAGVVLNGALNPDNQKAIECFGKVKTLFHVPHFHELTPAVLQTWVKERNDELITA